MSKFVGYTAGLECDGHGIVGKLVKVEYSRLSDGRIKLQATSGRDLSAVAGSKVITQAEFEDRPSDPYDTILEARWALQLCGWTLMSESDV